jgi:hypothetical protein
MTEINAASCIQYTYRYDDKGIRRIVPLEDRMFTVTGLASETPYEFKVVAVNKIGKTIFNA